MKVLGIIPAREGSKGIPGKNVKLLGGKPLIQYTIESAQDSSLLSKTILSTDSPKIAELATKLGAKVPFLRPAELAQDQTPSVEVVKHAISYFEKLGEQYEVACLLQPTNPFRPEGFIDKAIEQFKSNGIDSLISVLSVPDHYNPHWVFVSDKKGLLHISTGEAKVIPRRQELPVCYYRDGAIYLCSKSVLKTGSLLGSKLGYIQNTLDHNINLDTMEDWKKAEQLIASL